MNKQKSKSNLLSVGKNIEKSKVNVGSNNVINETNIQIDAINHYHDEEGLRPLFGRTLMASILDKAFRGEL